MPHRTVSWTRLSRSLRDSRPAIPAGLLGARALVQLGARTRPWSSPAATIAPPS